jgi:transposase-like protein
MDILNIRGGSLKKELTKEAVEQSYLKEDKTLNEVADEFGISSKKLRKFMKEATIDFKTKTG